MLYQERENMEAKHSGMGMLCIAFQNHMNDGTPENCARINELMDEHSKRLVDGMHHSRALKSYESPFLVFCYCLHKYNVNDTRQILQRFIDDGHYIHLTPGQKSHPEACRLYTYPLRMVCQNNVVNRNGVIDPKDFNDKYTDSQFEAMRILLAAGSDARALYSVCMQYDKLTMTQAMQLLLWCREYKLIKAFAYICTSMKYNENTLMAFRFLGTDFIRMSNPWDDDTWHMRGPCPFYHIWSEVSIPALCLLRIIQSADTNGKIDPVNRQICHIVMDEIINAVDVLKDVLYRFISVEGTIKPRMLKIIRQLIKKCDNLSEISLVKVMNKFIDMRWTRMEYKLIKLLINNGVDMQPESVSYWPYVGRSPLTMVANCARGSVYKNRIVDLLLGMDATDVFYVEHTDDLSGRPHCHTAFYYACIYNNKYLFDAILDKTEYLDTPKCTTLGLTVQELKDIIKRIFEDRELNDIDPGRYQGIEYSGISEQRYDIHRRYIITKCMQLLRDKLSEDDYITLMKLSYFNDSVVRNVPKNIAKPVIVQYRDLLSEFAEEFSDQKRKAVLEFLGWDENAGVPLAFPGHLDKYLD